MKHEQANQAAVACSMLRAHVEQPFTDYKWEELVGKLCRSEDSGLRDIGLRAA